MGLILARVHQLTEFLETKNLLQDTPYFIITDWAMITIQEEKKNEEIIAKSDIGFLPSSIYSWSIGHILEHEFFF